MNTTKKVAYVGILAALAIVLSVLEQYLPVQLLIPLPGIKLGVANIITLFALIRLDFKTALAILLVRCGVVALLFGTPVSLAMSLCGGVLSIGTMWLLLRAENLFSLCGASMAGAATHNMGQILCAVCVMQSGHVISYLPILLISAVITGILIAVPVYGVLRIIKKF